MLPPVVRRSSSLTRRLQAPTTASGSRRRASALTLVAGIMLAGGCAGNSVGGSTVETGGRTGGGQTGGAVGGNNQEATGGGSQGASGGGQGATGGNTTATGGTTQGASGGKGGTPSGATGGMGASSTDGGVPRDAQASGGGNADGGVGSQGGAPASGPLRVAINNDGNSYDTDDWGATALIGALLGQAADKVQLVHWGYNDNTTKTTSNGELQMRTSVDGVVSRFGLDASRVCDFRQDMSGCVKHLTDAINASSAASPLMIIMAGPQEVEYQALHAADPAKLQYVSVLSHSSWNDNFGPHTWSQVVKLGVKGVHITDQNAGLGATQSSTWSFLNTSGDARYQFVYQRFGSESGKWGDVSDAGMLYYFITGDQNGTPAKVKKYLGL